MSLSGRIILTWEMSVSSMTTCFTRLYVDTEEYYIPLGHAMVYNHSASPNAEWDIEDEDERFVKFYALKEIKQGEEILHDYGEEYWESRDAQTS